MQKQKMKKEAPVPGSLYVTCAHSVQNKILNGSVLREAEDLRILGNNSDKVFPWKPRFLWNGVILHYYD